MVHSITNSDCSQLAFRDNAGIAAQTTGSQRIVPLGSSGGNFSQFSLGGGFSHRPALPCQYLLTYFSPSSLFNVKSWPNYLQKPYPCQGIRSQDGSRVLVRDFLEVEVFRVLLDDPHKLHGSQEGVGQPADT